MNNTTWILIGDASRARLFACSGRSNPWTLVREFDHPGSRAKGQDIMADKPGRVRQSAGAGSRPAMAPPTPPKEVEAEHFAHQLGTVLEDGHGHNAYVRLVLVAPPNFLGLLRKVVSTPVSKRIVADVDKDYTHLPERQLPERLAGLW